MPSIPSVPLTRARPSFSLRSTGARPGAATASPAGSSHRRGLRAPPPRPSAARAQCDSGARSPLQPSEPYSWTTGVIPALSSGLAWSRAPADAAVAGGQGPQPEHHQGAHHLAFDGGSLPAACERTNARWSWRRSSTGMCRVASAPKPVETP